MDWRGRARSEAAGIINFAQSRNWASERDGKVIHRPAACNSEGFSVLEGVDNPSSFIILWQVSKCWVGRWSLLISYQEKPKPDQDSSA